MLGIQPTYTEAQQATFTFGCSSSSYVWKPAAASHTLRHHLIACTPSSSHTSRNVFKSEYDDCRGDAPYL